MSTHNEEIPREYCPSVEMVDRRSGQVRRMLAGMSLNTVQKNRVKTISATSAAVVTTATVGSLATNPNTLWYKSRLKPDFQPPVWLFPVAWTALYLDIAIVVGSSLADLEERREADKFQSLAIATVANLVLNAGWSLLFFKSKKAGLATFQAAALAVSSADLVRRCVDVDSKRGWFLAPYAGWTAFATLLTGAIWFKNRKRVWK